MLRITVKKPLRNVTGLHRAATWRCPVTVFAPVQAGSHNGYRWGSIASVPCREGEGSTRLCCDAPPRPLPSHPRRPPARVYIGRNPRTYEPAGWRKLASDADTLRRGINKARPAEARHRNRACRASANLHLLLPPEFDGTARGSARPVSGLRHGRLTVDANRLRYTFRSGCRASADARGRATCRLTRHPLAT